MRAARRNLPPPERFTLADRYRIILGVLAILLGLLMLYRIATLPGAFSLPAVLVALAFLGLGIYRSRMAMTRYREYRSRRTGDRP